MKTTYCPYCNREQHSVMLYRQCECKAEVIAIRGSVIVWFLYDLMCEGRKESINEEANTKLERLENIAGFYRR